MIKNWFGRKKSVICPRCLVPVMVGKEIGDRRCNNCSLEIPGGYIENFEVSPPIFMQVFGWTKHGKTLFLDTLRLTLMTMHPIWPNDYFYEGFTQLDLDKDREIRAIRQRGIMADSTQARTRDQNEVYIMNLRNMERWKNRMLVIMDHPGEYFEDLSVPVAEIPFLVNTPTTVMLISLPDILDDSQNTAGESIDQLFSIYAATLRKNKVDFKKEKRKLIIVFTKADKTKGLPANLKHYLMDDSIWSSIDNVKQSEMLTSFRVAEYLERMQRVSDEIAHWIQTDSRNVPGGANFIGLMNNYNVDYRFTLMSATGQDISKEDEGKFNITPRRVLDPFFWALEFQSR